MYFKKFILTFVIYIYNALLENVKCKTNKYVRYYFNSVEKINKIKILH